MKISIQFFLILIFSNILKSNGFIQSFESFTKGKNLKPLTMLAKAVEKNKGNVMVLHKYRARSLNSIINFIQYILQPHFGYENLLCKVMQLKKNFPDILSLEKWNFLQATASLLDMKNRIVKEKLSKSNPLRCIKNQKVIFSEIGKMAQKIISATKKDAIIILQGSAAHWIGHWISHCRTAKQKNITTIPLALAGNPFDQTSIKNILTLEGQAAFVQYMYSLNLCPEFIGNRPVYFIYSNNYSAVEFVTEYLIKTGIEQDFQEINLQYFYKSFSRTLQTIENNFGSNHLRLIPELYPVEFEIWQKIMKAETQKIYANAPILKMMEFLAQGTHNL